MNISDIIVGNRTRKNLGDIQQLANSITTIGLLHPVVVTPDNRLVAGYRRIMAYKLLGIDDIPHTVVSSLDGLSKLAEQHENTCRLDFTPSEAVEIGKIIEPLEKEQAKSRQISGKPSEKFSEGEALNKVASIVGLSRPTYTKAKKVVKFASENPDYQYIVEEMDETGKVDRAAKEMNRVIKMQSRQESTLSIPQSDNIWHGDFRNLIDRIPPNSVDLIFTDPPYNENSVELYKELGKFASLVLKPGGLCLAYSGQIFLPQVINALSQNLEYIWTFAIRHSSGYTRIFKVRARNMWKPILVYCKPPLELWWEVIDDMVDGKHEKDSHEWQQAVNEAEYYLSKLCPPIGLVIDPFCGSGTTLVAAKKLGLQFIGIDDDLEDVEKSIKRINDNTKKD